MKLIVVGLDGATFELLDPWLDEGALPNLKKIRKEGVWGNMESYLPPVSAPNWKSFSGMMIWLRKLGRLSMRNSVIW